MQKTRFMKNPPLHDEPQSMPIASERIKKILEQVEGKNLFKDIEDPSGWQRQIRSEWDRDFTEIR